MFKKKILPSIIFILSILGLVYFQYIPLTIFNLDINKFSTEMKMAYMFACDLGYMIVLFMIYRKRLVNNYKEYFKKFRKIFSLSFKYYTSGLIIMIVSNILISLFFKNATAGNENAIRSLIDSYPLYMIFSVSIYAPFTEELIFRQQIKDIVLGFRDNKITKYIYIILSGLIFASLHVVGSTESAIDYLFIIPYLGLGITFAALCYKTDNVVPSTMMHTVHNTFTIILYLLGSGI